MDGKVKGKCKNINVNHTEILKIRKQAAKQDLPGIIVVPCIQKEEVRLYAICDLTEHITALLKSKKD